MANETVEETKKDAVEDSAKTEEKTQEEKFYGKDAADKVDGAEEVKAEPEKEGDEQEEKVDDKKPIEFKLELSKDSPLDQEYIEAVVEWAKENGKSPEEAKEVLAHKEDAVLDYLEDQQEKLKLQTDEWVKDVKDDPVIGRDKFDESQALAQKPLNDPRFVSEEDRPMLMEFLKKTNLDKHPIFFKMLRSMGSAMSDDKYEKSETPAPRKMTQEERWYGEQARKE